MRTSFDLSAVDSLQSLAGVVAFIADAVGEREFIIVGATARDLILHHAHGIRERRRTEDLDIAVGLENWSAFSRLSNELVRRGAELRAAVHKFQINEWKVDVVPFGGVEHNGMIAWPPDGATAMSVVGFHEASEHAFHVMLPRGVKVRVTSPAGLLLLKVIAWRDRYPRSRRLDAVDLLTLVEGYAGEWNQNRIFEEADDLLQQFGFDLSLAAAALLGRDAAAIAKPETLKQVIAIVEQQTSEGTLTLANDMGPLVDDNLSRLEALLAGLRSPRPEPREDVDAQRMRPIQRVER